MAWEITKDLLSTAHEPSRVGWGEDHSRVPVQAALAGIQSEPLPSPGNEHPAMARIDFRLKDDDGEVYYEGWLHDDDRCLNQMAALDFGATDAGCTTIEVKRDGKWEVEIA